MCLRKEMLRDGSCAPDEDKVGPLCFPKCKDGYTGVGPVCWQDCPDDFRDDGAFCAKPSAYGRGAGYPWQFGDPLDSLKPAKKRCEKAHDQGCEKDGAIYYPKCKRGYRAFGCCTCSPACEDGMTDIGVSCAKKSYGRGVGRDPEAYQRSGGLAPLACTSLDLTRTLPTTTTTSPFAMVIASDPQLPWFSNDGTKLPYPDCRGDDKCVHKTAFKTNEQQLAAINDINRRTWGRPGPLVAPIQGVVINGDLTAYGHYEEWDWFMWYWTARLRWPAYYGLGNHDYDNNVGQCSDLSFDNNACAKRSIQWMRSTVSCGRTEHFPAQTLTSYDDASMAYAWDIGSFHFVQLQNHPTYPKKLTDDGEVTVAVPGIAPSLAWLKADLARATAAHKHIVLYMHDFGEHMDREDADFLAAIAGTNVRAIFSGHLHDQVGNAGHFQLGDHCVGHFHSGSSTYLKFLLTEFTPLEIRVAVVDAQTSPVEPLRVTETISLGPSTCQ